MLMRQRAAISQESLGGILRSEFRFDLFPIPVLAPLDLLFGSINGCHCFFVPFVQPVEHHLLHRGRNGGLRRGEMTRLNLLIDKPFKFGFFQLNLHKTIITRNGWRCIQETGVSERTGATTPLETRLLALQNFQLARGLRQSILNSRIQPRSHSSGATHAFLHHG